MALAAQKDVEADLGRVLSPEEAARVDTLLVKSSAVLIGWCGQDFEPAPYPDTVRVVAAGLVARVFSTAEAGTQDVTQQSAGPFAVSYVAGSTSTTPYLNANDKLALRPFRRGGGLSSVQMVGERYKITPDA